MKYLIILFLCLLTCPAILAQNETPTPDSTEAAPVTVIVQPSDTSSPTPANTDDLSSTELFFGLIIGVISIAALYFSHRSVPADKLNEFWKLAEAAAKKTDTTLDDDAVKYGKFASELLKQWQEKQSPAPSPGAVGMSVTDSTGYTVSTTHDLTPPSTSL